MKLKVWQKKALLVTAHAAVCVATAIVAVRLLDSQTAGEIIKEAAAAASEL